jgi:hypothetical protein
MDAATYLHPLPTSGDFFGEQKKKKKKKIDLAIGGGRDPPQRPGGEIRSPLVAIFASGEPTKKKKIRPLGVAMIHP